MNHAQRRPRHWFTRLTHPSYSLTHSPVEDLAVPQPGDILVQVLLEQVHQQEAAGRRDLNGDQSVVMDGQRLPKARFARVMNRSVRGLLVRGSSPLRHTLAKPLVKACAELSRTGCSGGRMKNSRRCAPRR